jgi:hypothetical protein
MPPLMGSGSRFLQRFYDAILEPGWDKTLHLVFAR